MLMLSNNGESGDFWAHVFGYLSIACWVVVFTPQLYENYKRQNTDGVSVPFLILWIFGDLFNLLGVILENLLVTMLLIAVYYLLSDILLMTQVVYYRMICHRDKLLLDEEEEEEEIVSESSVTIETTPLIKTDNESRKRTRRIVHWFCIASVLVSCIILGGAGFYFFGPTTTDDDKLDLSQWHWLPQLLGYASALLYCCSRIPQIMQNFRNESVEGLSIFMFIFSVTGNVTYCLSIFLKSMDRTYLLINFPWLLGSGGTLFFDFTIFFQFYIYRRK